MNDLAGRGYPGAEELTTIIPVITDEVDERYDWDNDDWSTRRRTPTAEITQDILIPEGEFDRYRHEAPFDVDGAHLDTYTEPDEHVGEVTETPEFDFTRRSAGAPVRSRGKHRIAAPPHALRGGRAALVAVAAGAALAAAAHVGTSDNTPTGAPVPAANVGDAAPAVDTGPGVAMSASDQDTSMYSDQLVVGKQLAAAEAAREAAASRPLFATPIDFSKPGCAFTSLFANRWGSFHGGIDLACPLGTPIHAVTDGVVINAGPASGYGNWVQVRADDGTVTMYGHMSSSGVLVQKGQHVTAGQTIALVGNEGFSTGPHLHFEVWKNGVTKIDPAPWLATHGIKLPSYGG
ncbi:M23 family metallopeptidase [Gordonia desulfuricans]|uniref:M23 family metallopeptidase n=1 Tax=Gordonia desulfuricans TaxID=89051 RepID=UPI000AD02D05|nr:M23 family metallopeptidase [Gordonia desulfuricans]